MIEFKSIVNMMHTLQTNEECRIYLEHCRWPNGIPVCPHCGSCSEGHYKIKQSGRFKALYKCQDCRNRFTVTVGTMFEGSHIPLTKWFYAIYLFTSHKKGVSSSQLHRDLNITQKTAWFMLGRIRHNLKDIRFQLKDMVQVDETYVGGKNYKKNRNKREKGTQGRSTKSKTAIMGLLSDEVVCTHIIPDATKKVL